MLPQTDLVEKDWASGHDSSGIIMDGQPRSQPKGRRTDSDAIASTPGGQAVIIRVSIYAPR